jgi:DNA-binding IclR family transcriptional regulator
MERGSESPELNRNIARTASILDVLAGASDRGLRLADVVTATGLGKTTAHRLLAGLTACGLADQDLETGRYFVGMKVLSLASAAKNRFAIAALAEPALIRLCQRTQDTVYLVARTGDEAVCLDCREGSFPIRVLTLDIGDRRPLGIGAGSMALLAFLPDEEIARIMMQQAEARAAFPFDDVHLRKMIETTRRQGYAYNNVHLFRGMESMANMGGIGVPIRRADGRPVAALHLTAVEARLEQPRRDNLVAALRQEAGQLEKDIEPALNMMRSSSTRSVAPSSSGKNVI